MQHLNDTGHQPGTIVVAAASLARYAEFWLAVEALQVPYGTRLIASRGADFVHQFNEGIRRMTGEWVFILGDDHTFNADLLLKLLDRKLDLVMPIVPRRDFPFVPVLMHGPWIEDKMRRYSWRDLPTKGLYRLPKDDLAGQAGALIRKPVLDKLGDPWFEGGKLTPGRILEDMYFVKRLHDLDIPIVIDCDQVMGHIANLNIVPQRHQGRWYAGYTTSYGYVIMDEPETSGVWGNNIKQVA